MAQVVVVAFSPLITRIYSPEVFGLQGVFLSMLGILSPLVALRFPMAIITAETNVEVLKLVRLAIIVAIASTSLLLGGLLLGGETAMILIGAEKLGSLVFLLPLALFSVALQEITDYHAARLGAFRLIGIVSVCQAFATNSARVVGGLMNPIAFVLVLVSSLAPALKSTMLMIGSRDLRFRATGFTVDEAVHLVKKYRDFPFYRMPTDFIRALSSSAPIVFLSAFYSPAVAGFYLLAHTVIKLPLNVIGVALGNVIYAKFAELERERKPLFPLASRVTVIQLLGPGSLLLIIGFYFPPLFSFAFGKNWATAGEYGQWMVLWVVCMLANIPTVRALPVIGRQGWHLAFNCLIAVVGIGGLFLGAITSSNAYEAVMFYSIATSVVYVCQIVTYLILIHSHDMKESSSV